MILRAILPLLFILCGSSPGLAFDSNFEGRVKTGVQHIFESPQGFSSFDRDAELRLGVLGNALEKDEWKLDYEVTGDARYVEGPREEAGLDDRFKAEFFRAWFRFDNETFKVRGGRQKILFGSGTIFRPLGFFDTRDVSGVVPETKGVDGVQTAWFLDQTTLVEGWAIPARKDGRAIMGFRHERMISGVEAGVVFQYHPMTELNDLPDFNRELIQTGYHLKGENVLGFWNESRLDVEQKNGQSPLRFDTVLGIDYTFRVGAGLHVAAEYFVSTRESQFLLPAEHLTFHQFGVSFDQPVGIATVWRIFNFYDVRDGSFQVVPQIEYAVTNQAFLYLHGRWGGNVNGNENVGRFYLKGTAFNGTEPSLGVALVVYF